MADSAVVITRLSLLRLIPVSRNKSGGRAQCFRSSGPRPIGRDHILVPVVRKLYCELLRDGGFREWEAGVVARGNARVADGADSWARAPVELLSVTLQARVMIRVVCHVREGARLTPVGRRCLVTGTARLLPVALARMREF